LEGYPWNEGIVQDSGDEGDFEKASSTLGEGLESCRSVLAGYRALLRGGQPPTADANAAETEAPDQQKSPPE
jgi:hypothetical protein